jgi:hypothetical protein
MKTELDMTQAHLALLGDSIFDNGAYTEGGPDVLTHLRRLLPAGWKVSLLARDGDMTVDVAGQLARLPDDVTHLVISIGGNDALNDIDMLDLPVSSTGAALDLFAGRMSGFASHYAGAIDTALQWELPTTVCTIYEGNFDAEIASRVSIALTMYNNVILRTAFSRGLSVIDLGLVCTEAADYWNPIEPSAAGGLKIARMIATSLQGAAAPAPHSRVHAYLPPTP